MSKGILLLSVGNPYYIRMAYQLAYSIKCNENIPICLIQNNVSFLSEEQQQVFDTIKEIPSDIVADKKYFRAKTRLYELSPYDETIYLDVDMIALNNKLFSSLFEELKEINFTMACRGTTNLNQATPKTSIWGNIIYSADKLKIKEGVWYQLSSEFIYFKKNKDVKRLFDKTKEIYDSDIEHTSFANGMADEFAFGLACMATNMYPHKETFKPIYWAHAEKRTQRIIDPFVNENYYGYSMGGAYASQNQKGFYMNMLTWYQQKTMKKINVFPAESKARYIETRKSI